MKKVYLFVSFIATLEDKAVLIDGIGCVFDRFPNQQELIKLIKEKKGFAPYEIKILSISKLLKKDYETFFNLTQKP